MVLFVLGRRLMMIAEEALPRNQGAMSVRLVLIDVAYHPNSSISEITERTGFPQSLVSTAVARLREVGVVESESDPLDRRRTLVRTTPALRTVSSRLDGLTVDDLLADQLSNEEVDQLPRVVDALNLLSRLLTPGVNGGNADETFEGEQNGSLTGRTAVSATS